MKIKVVNEDKSQVLVLIHGGNSTYNEWEEYLPYFSNYCLYLVSISGHGEDFESEYTSIETNAMEICEYVKEHTSSCYVFGRGLGAQIALAMIEQEPSLVKKVIFESLSCCYLGLFKLPIKIAANLNYKVDKAAVEQKLRLSKAKFRKMVADNSSFVLDVRINGFNNEALLLYASDDDKFFKKSADLMKGYVRNLEVKSYNFGHLFGLTHTKDIIEDILKFLNTEKVEEVKE